jgi:hypothetical protein
MGKKHLNEQSPKFRGFFSACTDFTFDACPSLRGAVAAMKFMGNPRVFLQLLQAQAILEI